MRSKVAAVTPIFWVITILMAGMGETLSDLLTRAVDPMLVVGCTVLLLAGMTAVQVVTRRYHHWLYWSTVAVSAVVGTMVADTLHVLLGAGYAVTSVALVCVIAVVFAMWYLAEATIDVRTVATRTRETFHWVAVATTFALGTAVGDLTSSSLGLGHPVSAVVVGLLIAAPAIAHRWLALPMVPAFWCAYVLARPLGVALADAVAVDLGVGDALVAAGLLLVIVALVWRATPRRAVPTTVREPLRPAPAPAARAAQVDEVWIG